MSATLVLIGGATPEAALHWALVENGRVSAHDVADTRAPPPMGRERTLLIIPGADAQVKRVQAPARSAAQARAAAPFLFEGALAATAGVHYAVGEAQDEAGHRLIAAISEARLRAWIARGAALGAEPGDVFLDFTLWPTPAGEAAILEAGERTIVAGGRLGGFTIEPDLAPALFARWCGGIDPPLTRVRLYGGDGRAWQTRAGFVAPAIVDGEAGDLGEALAIAAAERPDVAPNLRQGAFAPAHRGASPWRIWRIAAGLAVIAVLLQAANLAIAGLRDHDAARATLAAAERDFRALRPDVGRIVNLRAQVAGLMNALRQSGAHPVLTASAPLIEMMQAQQGVQLEELRHEAPGRRVHLRLSAAQAPQLEAAIAGLKQRGLSIEAHEMGAVEGRYSIDLTLDSP